MITLVMGAIFGPIILTPTRPTVSPQQLRNACAAVGVITARWAELQLQDAANDLDQA